MQWAVVRGLGVGAALLVIAPESVADETTHSGCRPCCRPARVARCQPPRIEAIRSREPKQEAIEPAAGQAASLVATSADAAPSQTGAAKMRDLAWAHAVAKALAHCQVQLSWDLVARAIERPVRQAVPVNYAIKGVPIRGTAQVEGATRLVVVPDPARAVFEVLFSGTALSNTTASAGPVRVHATATTAFAARKRIVLDEQGLTICPAQCRAETNSTITGVSSTLPGLRGQLLRLLGDKQAHAEQAEADLISARHTERSLSKQFDSDFDREIVWVIQALEEVLACQQPRSATAKGSQPRRICFSSTAEHLVIGRAAAEGHSADGPPMLATRPPVAIHLKATAGNIAAVMGAVAALPAVTALVPANAKAAGPPGADAKPTADGKTAPKLKVAMSLEGGWLSLRLDQDDTQSAARLATRP
jgi:hypothetical protein